jgi:hypothetical protein
MPLTVAATEINIQSDTLIRVDNATAKNAAVTPIYEYLQVDIDTPDEPGLAFHFYGWGRDDIANNQYYNDATTGELLYGYVEYTHALARFNTRLGRQYVFEGVANEVVDGLRVSSDLGRYFSGSFYGGQPAALDSDNGRSGDSIYGGRLAHTLRDWYNLGVSYKKIRNSNDNVEETAGIDMAAFLPYDVSMYGFSAYNLDSDGWAELSYELRCPIGPVALRPYFQKFQYEDYFGSGVRSRNSPHIAPGPFRFLANTGEELQVGGADLTLPVGDAWVLMAKAKHYDYLVRDDTSQYYATQATWMSSEGHSQIGGEFGYMNGDVAENTYYLVRAFAYWDQLPEGCPVWFISGDVVYVGYDEAIYGEDSSLFLSLGIGKKLFEDTLELKLTGDYGNDPYNNDEVRGMLKVSYHYNRTL